VVTAVMERHIAQKNYNTQKLNIMRAKLIILSLLSTSLFGCTQFQEEDTIELDPQNGASAYNQELLKSKGFLPRYHRMYEFPITELPEEILARIPQDHIVIDTASGDLNFDGYRDIIVVSSSYDNKYENDFLRPLFIFFGSDADFILHDFSGRVILGRESGGMMPDPFAGLYAQNGFISIKHYGGSGGNQWSRETMFLFEPELDRFELCLDILDNWQMERNRNFSRKHLFDNEHRITLSDFEIYEQLVELSLVEP